MIKSFKYSKYYIYLLRPLFVLLLLLPFQNCSDFNAINSDSSSSLTTDSEMIAAGNSLYSSSCAGCHGPIDSSSKKGREFGQILWSVGNIPQMSGLSHLSKNELTYISRALIFESEGGGVEKNPSGRDQFVCDPSQTAKASILKLSNKELENSITEILQMFNQYLPNDAKLRAIYKDLPSSLVAVAGDVHKEQSKLVTQDILVSYFEAAYRASEIIATSNGSIRGNLANTNRCLGASTIDEACHNLMIREVGQKLFRKKMTAAEAEILGQTLWDSSLDMPTQIQTSLTAMMTMPEFFYKAYNNGELIPGTTNQYQLSSMDLASKLSFFLTQKPMDDTLKALAESNAIQNPSVLSQQADRLLATDDAKAVIVRLFRESYGYELFGSFEHTFSVRRLDGINVNTTDLMSKMSEELDNFFVNEVITKNGAFKDLFTSVESEFTNNSYSVATNGLAAIYGVTGYESGLINLPPERAGFLNRAAMLTKRDGAQTSSIKRGLAVLEKVLCVDVGAPPPNAPTELPELTSNFLTTRQHSFQTTEGTGTSCATCHSRINPLGYAFENFDTLGRLRLSERIFDLNTVEVASLPIETNSETKELGDSDIIFNDSIELSSQLGESDKAALCFAKKLKEFESRNEKSLDDNCQTNEALDVIYGSSQPAPGTVKDAIKAIVLSEKFKIWSN